MKSGIYQILNTVNGKIYIGSTTNLRARKSGHFTALSRGRHENPRLQNAWNLYGSDVWVFEVLELCPTEQLLILEQRYLDRFWDGGINCYNIAKIAEAPGKGIPKSPETKAKMAAAKRGKPKSPEHKAKIAQALKGRVFSREHIERVAELNRGNKYALRRNRDNETGRKISDPPRNQSEKPT